ncbi:MAG TPA: xanthine dehydrogenase molybdopterin binding subunit [Verrucomicrobiaceae bacterium]
MSASFEFQLNGATVRIVGMPPHVTLLEWLRASGFTGSKEGCAEGDCGACSVAVAMAGSDGNPCWRAINSCLVPLPALAGRRVVTVEGLKRGKLHPVQSAMVRHHGSQCGYCTPGVVMSLFEACHRCDLKSEAQLNEQLAGNLCRCTGYRSIREAALEVLGKDCEDGMEPGGAPLEEMEYDAVEGSFHRPGSLAELFSVMKRHPDASLLAGATELGLEITKKFRKFPVLISLEAVREMVLLRETQEAWHIGAAVPLTILLDRLGGEHPALKNMLWWFGSRQIRNRATLGGNLVTASPIGDAAPLLLTFESKLVLASEHGERTVSIEEFFVDYRKTVLQPGEVLKTVVLPRHDGYRRMFYKVSKRREMDISTVAGCFALKLDGSGFVDDIKMAYGGVSSMPVRARKTEAAMRGKKWSTELIEAVKPVLAAEFKPISDTRGTAAYRGRLLTNLLEKFFREDSAEDVDAPLPAAAPAMEALAHESGHKHVTGEALYVDDTSQHALETWPVLSPHAHAKIVKLDASVARRMPGVHAVLLAENIPGMNDAGPVRHDEPLLAEHEVQYHGQLVALVVAETLEHCRAAAAAVVVQYESLPALLDLRAAIAAESFHTPAHAIRRGDALAAIASAPFKLSGEFAFGGQDHFYLESQAAWAEVGEDGSVFINSSTQHPSEVQAAAAHVLGLKSNAVVVQCPRMGGGFGGKETQAAAPAVLAALASSKTGKKVRVRYNRDQDMMITGKRHPFLARFEAGFDGDGKILAVRAKLYADGGWSLDLSRAIADRAILHMDNAYYLPHADFRSWVVKTNVTSHTAFRGFGGPQGMLVIEEIMDRIARRTGLAPETVRERNLYHGTGDTNTTHYGQLIEDNRIQRAWCELTASSKFADRRREIAAWNAGSSHRRRGIAITPVKFGISFTLSFLNQAGALVLIFKDGTVQVNHGATEMGQGVYTNIAQIAARELEIPVENIRVMATRTDKVPNTSATAASCGTDLNGMAVKHACTTLRERLASFRTPDRSFALAVEAAYMARVSLSATGYYATPGVHMDWANGRGKPFHYFAVGAAVTEVEVDGLTGMMRVLRTDILHDVGASINAAVNRGQIEGGFVQGMGWLTTEELVWDREGRLLTHSPDTYKIPSMGDRPIDFRVAFLSDATQPNTIHGSKAVGEPPLMLAISVREAIRDAIASWGGEGEIALASPATPEAVLRAIDERRGCAVEAILRTR